MTRIASLVLSPSPIVLPTPPMLLNGHSVTLPGWGVLSPGRKWVPLAYKYLIYIFFPKKF